MQFSGASLRSIVAAFAFTSMASYAATSPAPQEITVQARPGQLGKAEGPSAAQKTTTCQQMRSAYQTGKAKQTTKRTQASLIYMSCDGGEVIVRLGRDTGL